MDPRLFTDQLLSAFMARDLPAVLAMFEDDAVVVDPHYPIPEMKGLVAIRRGFTWAFANIERPGFSLIQLWSEGARHVIEVDTHHVFKGGMELRFRQLFVAEMGPEKLRRLAAYVPYPPPGIGGLVARLTRWIWWLRGVR